MPTPLYLKLFQFYPKIQEKTPNKNDKNFLLVLSSLMMNKIDDIQGHTKQIMLQKRITIQFLNKVDGPDYLITMIRQH